MQLRRGSWLPASGTHVKLAGHVSFPLQLDLRPYTGFGDASASARAGAAGRAVTDSSTVPHRASPQADYSGLGNLYLRQLQRVWLSCLAGMLPLHVPWRKAAGFAYL